MAGREAGQSSEQCEEISSKPKLKVGPQIVEIDTDFVVPSVRGFVMEYEGNPKHKEPWQRGRRGSLCPKDVDLTLAQKLLDASIVAGEKRFAAHEGKAYCAMEHGAGLWHGFPVGWGEVPPDSRNDLIRRRPLHNLPKFVSEG